MDEKNQTEYSNLISKYDVDLSSLEPLKYIDVDEIVYVEEFRVLFETLKRKYNILEVDNLINNAISHKLIELRETIEECEDDLIEE